MSGTNLKQCLNCERSEAEVPLVSLRFSEQPHWICTQCLPTLIHKPYLLASKLAGAEDFPVTAED